MKKILYVSFFVLLVVHFGSAQTTRQKYMAITRRTMNLQNDTALKSLVLHKQDFLSQQTEDDGTLTGYFKHDTLVKLDEELLMSYGGQRFICTFYNNRPDFAYTEEWHFPIDSLGKVSYTTVQPVFNRQYYFDAGKAFDSTGMGTANFYKYPTSNLVLDKASKAREIIMNKKKQP